MDVNGEYCQKCFPYSVSVTFILADPDVSEEIDGRDTDPLAGNITGALSMHNVH